MLIKGFRGVADRVERLVPLGTMQGNVAFLAYRTWGEEILFFDRQGAQIGRRQFDGEGIDWVAADGRHVLVGLNGSGGLRLLEFQVGSES
ncbi:MAG: hypothetical protein HY290_26935, partial [Planctomycetia bacterium]|nr:hypothetical protein [Planctomycetia bacterium]